MQLAKSNKKNISKKVKANRLNKLFTISSNDISIILKYEEDFSILFTGDAGDKVINKLIYKQLVKNIDVLKIPHHGGKNSVEKNILKTLKPSFSSSSILLNDSIVAVKRLIKTPLIKKLVPSIVL